MTFLKHMTLKHRLLAATARPAQAGTPVVPHPAATNAAAHAAAPHVSPAHEEAHEEKK